MMTEGMLLRSAITRLLSLQLMLPVIGYSVFMYCR